MKTKNIAILLPCRHCCSGFVMQQDGNLRTDFRKRKGDTDARRLIAADKGRDDFR